MKKIVIAVTLLALTGCATQGSVTGLEARTIKSLQSVDQNLRIIAEAHNKLVAEVQDLQPKVVEDETAEMTPNTTSLPVGVSKEELDGLKELRKGVPLERIVEGH